MGQIDFRNAAKDALKRAEIELKTKDPVRIKYAALELRFAMESITYDRAQGLKEEIPPEEYKTWQPRQLMQYILQIDPTLGMSSKMSFGEQDNPHTPAPPEKMKNLGQETVFTLKDLKKYYDSIGSFLHTPSASQYEKNKIPSYNEMREKCEAAYSILKDVLESKVFNVFIGNFATLPECLEETCKKPIRKRIPYDKKELDTKCFHCGLEYRITSMGNGQSIFEPKNENIQCPTEGCNSSINIWRHKIRVGAYWKCQECKIEYAIGLGIFEKIKN